MFRKGTKLPSSVSAPEEASLGEVSLSNIIDANGHEVVVFNSVNLSPELKLFKLKFFLELVESKIESHSLFNTESNATLS